MHNKPTYVHSAGGDLLIDCDHYHGGCSIIAIFGSAHPLSFDMQCVLLFEAPFSPLLQYFSIQTILEGFQWTVQKMYDDFATVHRAVSLLYITLEPRPSSPRFYLAALEILPRFLYRSKIWARKAWV